MDDKPPSKGDKDSPKLCIPSSWDIRSVIYGCQPLLAGVNSFRSLAWISFYRRDSILDVNKEN